MKNTNVLIVALLGLVLLASGCALLTPPVRVSVSRAGSDVTMTILIDNKVITADRGLEIVAKLREALEKAKDVPEYKEKINSVLGQYAGVSCLARLLLKSVPKAERAWAKIGNYRYGLTQALNQAELAATEYKEHFGSP